MLSEEGFLRIQSDDQIDIDQLLIEEAGLYEEENPQFLTPKEYLHPKSKKSEYLNTFDNYLANPKVSVVPKLNLEERLAESSLGTSIGEARSYIKKSNTSKNKHKVGRFKCTGGDANKILDKQKLDIMTAEIETLTETYKTALPNAVTTRGHFCKIKQTLTANSILTCQNAKAGDIDTLDTHKKARNFLDKYKKSKEILDNSNTENSDNNLNYADYLKSTHLNKDKQGKKPARQIFKHESQIYLGKNKKNKLRAPPPSEQKVFPEKIMTYKSPECVAIMKEFNTPKITIQNENISGNILSSTLSKQIGEKNSFNTENLNTTSNQKTRLELTYSSTPPIRYSNRFFTDSNNIQSNNSEKNCIIPIFLQNLEESSYRSISELSLSEDKYSEKQESDKETFRSSFVGEFSSKWSNLEDDSYCSPINKVITDSKITNLEMVGMYQKIKRSKVVIEEQNIQIETLITKNQVLESQNVELVKQNNILRERLSEFELRYKNITDMAGSISNDIKLDISQ